MHMNPDRFRDFCGDLAALLTRYEVCLQPRDGGVPCEELAVLDSDGEHVGSLDVSYVYAGKVDVTPIENP